MEAKHGLKRVCMCLFTACLLRALHLTIPLSVGGMNFCGFQTCVFLMPGLQTQISSGGPTDFWPNNLG